jgi:hypothetical protein
MKTSGNVDLCQLILPVIVFLPKNVSTSPSSSSDIYFDPLCCNVDVGKKIIQIKVISSISRHSSKFPEVLIFLWYLPVIDYITPIPVAL